MSTPPLPQPPQLPYRFLAWYCKDELLEEIEGDLYQEYQDRHERSRLLANSLYLWQVITFFRPFALKRWSDLIPNNMMLKHYTKVAWRVTLRNRGYAAINIGGLAVGMAVALLIGLWIHSEFTFNQYHATYPKLTQVMSHSYQNGELYTSDGHTVGLGTALRDNYSSHLDGVASVRRPSNMIIGLDETQILETGQFVGVELPRMLALKMKSGSYRDFGGKSTILLSESTAQKLFGEKDPTGQSMVFNGDWDVSVLGVYEDLPKQSTFHGIGFMVPLPILLDLYGTDEYAWDNYFLECYALLKPDRNAAEVSELIEDVSLPYLTPEAAAERQPRIFLEPMANWHLYSAFEGGHRITSSRMRFVYLYGLIGLFVLILACINFMNLSTARSEKRAKEVGIRKTIGSVRRQLIHQFLSESILISVLALILAIFLAAVSLPWFNRIADKEMVMLWQEPYFWLALVGFAIGTSLLAGSYPALFLSSFQPIRVLKGAYRTARSAVISRKALVVTQFAISILLFVGTLVVYQQIQFAKMRPAGYNYDDLVMIRMRSSEMYQNYQVMEEEWLASGAVIGVARSSYSVADTRGWNHEFDWEGRPPGYDPSFNTITVDPEYGQTVGWEIIAGRDFDPNREGDRQGVILNESAAELIGLEDPIGQVLTWSPNFFDEPGQYTILGVATDMVKGSPFEETFPSIIFLSFDNKSWINLRLNPQRPTQENIAAIEAVFEEYVSKIPFNYEFVDEVYKAKFADEERIGELSAVFAGLAIFISCLGLLGLASYMAEQRTKEIGIRKVLGATVGQLWGRLSRDFLLLVLLAGLFALPLSYYCLNLWLQEFEYRTDIPLWVLGIALAGALVVTLFTVSLHSLRAARANPIRSLRSE
ncbi:MAG: FtsX-like permease family protein [Bacteroidota bacterium]